VVFVFGEYTVYTVFIFRTGLAKMNLKCLAPFLEEEVDRPFPDINPDSGERRERYEPMDAENIRERTVENHREEAMSHAIRMYETGGPEVLRWEPYEPPEPGPGEVLIRHEAVGLNFIDIYHRTGLYPLPGLPATPGMEGAGIVEAVGAGVTEVRPGNRVAYAGLPPGAYAERRILPAHRLVRVPEEIALQTAAAMMLQGMTARYLLKRCYPVGKDTTLLIHAAAGGVGSIVCQWGKSLGATIIGTVGTEDKAVLAKQNGCDYPIRYTAGPWVPKVREITGNRGVDVVYDSVGQATFLDSLDCLRPMGTMVTFGQSSGPIAPLDTRVLSQKGSLFLTRPSLMSYTEKREDLLAHAKDLFEVVRKGVVRIRVAQTYPLREAARAHQDLEARKTHGSSVLMV
jgi:NADPH:quinone reductase